MATFRGFVIIGGLLVLSFVWGAFAWVLREYDFETSLRVFLWSYVVSSTFLVVARMWDVQIRDRWCHHIAEKIEGIENGQQFASDSFN